MLKHTKLLKLALIPTLVSSAFAVASTDLPGSDSLTIDDGQQGIVGGQTANTALWPFYTQILNSNGSTSFCGGSYIGNGYVLTAAHCVTNKSAAFLNVKVAGFTQGGSDGDRIGVSEKFVHPQYNRSTLSNDIALLKLDRNPRVGGSVTLADASISQYARVGDMLSVAGLGRLSEGGARPSQLMSVDVPLVSDAECRVAGGPYSNVGDVAFCAGYPQGQKDSCSGDSGGPIVINSGGQIVQLGIVSWGIGCARPNNYGVYADVAALRTWVDSVVGGTVPVTIDYAASTTLPKFVVGDIIKHTFTIKNAGSKTFTFNTVNATSSGVTSGLAVTRNTCNAATLLQNDNCKVDVEFSASRAGTSNVSLNFTVDESTTNYTAKLTATVTDGSDVCDGTWNARSVYGTGDQVTYRGRTYQARWWTQGDVPTDSGYYGVWQDIGTDPTCQK